MDLITYFKAEFSPSGKNIREVMSFFAGAKEQCMLQNIPERVVKNSIGLNVLMWSDQSGFFVQHSGSNKAPVFGKTAVLAALEFQLQHHELTSVMWGNPWIDADRWRSRVSKTDVETQSGLEYLLTLLAELKLHQHLWAAHRKSDDYIRLHDEDKLIVDSVGPLMKLFKYEVVLMLSKSNAFSGLSACGETLSQLEKRVASERFSSWHRFSEQLTPTYKQRVHQTLSSLKN